MRDYGLREELEHRGISRREFLTFCASMAVVLGLPDGASRAIAAAVEGEVRPILLWLEFQDCAGNSESLLRAGHPTVANLILDSISLSYHETLMAAAGSQAEDVLTQTARDNAGKYIVLVEGSIPSGADGAYCMIGGDHCGRYLRSIWRHPGGASESDRRFVGRRRAARHQEPHQYVGLPGQCGEHHRIDRLLHDLKAVAAA